MNNAVAQMASTKFWVEFLELYKNLPALWNKRSEKYSNRKIKAESYNKMVEKLQEIDPTANREMVVRKINTFRTNYRREVKHRNYINSKKSGTDNGKIYKSSLWYFDMLSFIDYQKDPLERTIPSDEYKSLPSENKYSSKLPKKKKILKKVIKQTNDETLVKIRCDHLNKINDKTNKIDCENQKEDNNDEATILAKAWATQYTQLSNKQKLLSRKIISDVLFHGCLNHLTENTVQEINNVLDSSNWNNDYSMESEVKIEMEDYIE